MFSKILDSLCNNDAAKDYNEEKKKKNYNDTIIRTFVY